MTDWREELARFVAEAPGNVIGPERALAPEWAGLRLYEEPLVGTADAGDPLFAALQAPEAVGPWFRVPGDWLPGARTVLSFFLPFSRRVRESNIPGRDPSGGWLHGRVEGQAFLMEACRYLKARLEAEGYEAVIPCDCPEFWSVGRAGSNPRAWDPSASFTSVWSERHVAYVCGLGTFGLSRGLITEKGQCGRFGSLVTTAPLPATPRPCTGLYDYCTRCGACAARCPAGAISLAEGKAHPPCAAYLAVTGRRFPPRYGCGKCQVGVPCMSRIPLGREK